MHEGYAWRKDAELSAYPRTPSPELLKRAPLVISEPPSAEQVLESDEGHAHQPAHGMSAYTVKSESPIVEKHCAENRLPQVVGQAHSAVRRYLYQP